MQKRIFFNVFFAFALLASIIGQSLHAIAHYEEDLTAKHCTHRSPNRVNLTHEHLSIKHCQLCDFIFFGFTQPNVVAIKIPLVEPHTFAAFSDSREIIFRFSGSLFALRAPPRI